jgi:bidirectional [NiFe] hydrogenase diaphorase subunit
MAELHADLEPVLRRCGRRPDGLLEVLSCAQDLHGHLSQDLLRHVAQQLRLPLSRVLGTASFYHLFRLDPPAPHSCLVCRGTACFVLGADALLAALQAEPLAEEGIELGVVRCIGTCSGAPLLVVDGEVWNHQNAAVALVRLRRLAT